MKAWGKLLGRSESDSNLVQIGIEQIVTSPFQPRQEFDDLELRDLASSIHEVGLIQPIVVRKTPDGYELVAGERRLRACKLLGLKEIPAVLMDLDNQRMAMMGLIENLQRKNLNYFEEAAAYARLIDVFGLTQEQVAQRVGRSQSAIANRLRILKIGHNVRKRITPESISERHVRALLKLENEEDQLLVLNQIYDNGLNVRQTEEVIERINQNISREINRKESKVKNDSLPNANTIVKSLKGVVNKAQEAGVQLIIDEYETQDSFEFVIRVPKTGR